MELATVKDYLRIDSMDEDTLLIMLIETSENYIDTMVGTNYKSDVKLQKLADLLTLKLVSDMYENRETTTKEDKKDKITTSILHALSLAKAPVVTL